MEMKKFFVGAKAIIRSDRGVLLIKHANGYWDMPGGRLNDDEDLEEGLLRELREEVPNVIVRRIGEQAGAYRVHHDLVDDISLVIIFFLVDAVVPEELTLSEEHGGWQWVGKDDELPQPLDVNMAKIVDKYRQ